VSGRTGLCPILQHSQSRLGSGFLTSDDRSDRVQRMRYDTNPLSLIRTR